jgi:hypothetical protein
LRIYSENGQYDARITNNALFNGLGISEKKRVIICGIMRKYIDCGNTKSEIEEYLMTIFRKEMAVGNMHLEKITGILDNDIKL